MSIPHIWYIDAPRTPLVSMQPGLKYSCGVALVIFIARIISDYEHLIGVTKLLIYIISKA